MLAIDGVFLRVPQAKSGTFWMNQAGRWEVEVSCSQSGTWSIETEFYPVLLKLIVSGSTVTSTATTAAELAAIVRPDYLADLTSATATSNFAMHFSQGGSGRAPCAFWLGSGSDCTAVWKGTAQPTLTTTGNTCPFQSWPGKQGGNGTDDWDSSRTYKHVTAVGQVNQWKIYGLGMDSHPFHIHVNHF